MNPMVNLHMNVMTMGGCRVWVIKQARINLTVALKQSSKKKKQFKKPGQTGVSGPRGLRGPEFPVHQVWNPWQQSLDGGPE